MTPCGVRWMVALFVVASACTGQARLPSASPAGPRIPDPRAPTPSGPDPLCGTGNATLLPSPGSVSSSTAELSAVAQQVEVVRGLEFDEGVAAEAVTRDQMGDIVRGSVDSEFPVEMMERRARAWATIGAIPTATDLYGAIADYGASQTIGLYNTATDRLYYVTAGQFSPLERLTLAHEMTHALDDQHFDLGLLDQLIRTCQDERAEAFLSLGEGDAVEMSFRWAQAHLSASELVDLGVEVAAAPGPPASVPPFVSETFLSPYLTGQAFVRALLAGGGQKALDAAFRDPPRSTEQVLHPEKYGLDEPQVIQVPDVEEELGEAWDDLDVQDVGEAWLLRLLHLELPSSDATDAAAGWDGGQYRAWADGTATAVVLETLWDSDEDAAEFAAAIEIYAQGRPITAVTEEQAVRVLFASDAESLRALEAALAGT
jgi:hypothetical protein